MALTSTIILMLPSLLRHVLQSFGLTGKDEDWRSRTSQLRSCSHKNILTEWSNTSPSRIRSLGRCFTFGKMVPSMGKHRHRFDGKIRSRHGWKNKASREGKMKSLFSTTRNVIFFFFSMWMIASLMETRKTSTGSLDCSTTVSNARKENGSALKNLLTTLVWKYLWTTTTSIFRCPSISLQLSSY